MDWSLVVAPRTVRPELVEGFDGMKIRGCDERAHAARGSHFSCFAKKSNQKKATPTIRLFPPVLAFRGMR